MNALLRPFPQQSETQRRTLKEDVNICGASKHLLMGSAAVAVVALLAAVALPDRQLRGR